MTRTMNISSTGIRLSRMNTRVRLVLRPDLEKTGEDDGDGVVVFHGLFPDQVVEHRLQVVVGGGDLLHGQVFFRDEAHQGGEEEVALVGLDGQAVGPGRRTRR